MFDSFVKFVSDNLPAALLVLVAVSTAIDSARAFLVGEFTRSDDFSPATEEKITGVLGSIGKFCARW